MRALKITGFVIAGLFAALILLLVAVWIFVNPNDYKGRIAQAVKDSTGRTLTLSGDIKLSVFPWVALELGPASLSSPAGFGEEPFAGIQHAVLRVKLLPLLHKQLQIGQITLKGLDLRLKKNAAGKGNWEDFGSKTPAAPPPPEVSGGGGEALRDLAGLAMSDSRIAYQDTVLQHVDLDVGHVTATTPAPVKISLDLIPGRESTPLHIVGQFDASLDVPGQHYRLNGLHLQGSYTPKPGTAPLPWDFSAPDLTVDLTQQTLGAPNLSFQLGSARIRAAVTGSKIVDAPRMSGSFELAPLALRDFMAKLGMTPPVTREASAFSKLAASGNYSYGDNALSADRLVIGLDGSTLRGNAAITDLHTLALSFNLGIDRIDFDGYRSPPAPPAPAPAGPAAKPANLPTTPLKSLIATGTMTIGAARVAGVNLTNVSVSVHASDGVTRIAPARAQLYGGQYAGTITLDERNSQSMIDMDQSMTSIDVAQLLNDFAKSKRLSGRGTINSHLAAHGRSSDEFVKTLNGHIDANLADGAIEGIDLWYEINRAQSLLRQQALPAGSSSEHTKFDAFKASANVVNGIATTTDLNIASQELHVSGHGTTNLVRQEVDYDLKATLMKSTPGSAQNRLALAEIPVKISGPLTHPSARPDLAGMARAGVQQELDKHKDELKKKVEDQLQNLLKPRP